MKEFFKMFFASVLGVITAGIILFCISLFIFFGIVAGIASKATGGAIPKIEANSILHIDNSLRSYRPIPGAYSQARTNPYRSRRQSKPSAKPKIIPT